MTSFLQTDESRADVKNETNKDGSGKGQWSAWKVMHHSPLDKNIFIYFFPWLNVSLSNSSWPAIPQATKLSKKYEEAGGEYENEAGSKNEPTKGAPKAKSQAIKNEELKNDQSSDKDTSKKDNEEEEEEDKPEKGEEAKSEKQAVNKKGESRSKAPPKEKKTPATGTRKSVRIGDKRAASEAEAHEAEDDEIEEDRKTNKRSAKK